MTALEYANSHENVIVRIAGNGCPAGRNIAWIPPETALPFDLEEVEGEIDVDGYFTARNLFDGRSGIHGWRFHDWNGNLLYAIWLWVDTEIWEEQHAELMGE